MKVLEMIDICYGISDIKIGKDKYHPLEQDSIDIVESLGGEYQGKLKMLMTRMIGLDPSSSGIKNSVKMKGEYYKYEPIFIFIKKRLDLYRLLLLALVNLKPTNRRNIYGKE